jgi:NADH dehydrogenase (ubiquinone) 1 alpha subcomplex subunit 9
MRHLNTSFDIGMSAKPFYSPRDRPSVKRAIEGCDVVVNLIGKNYETRSLADKKTFPFLEYKVNYDFEETHVTIPKMLAEVSKECGVNQFIHLSSVAASPDHASSWARSKHAGELAVKEVLGKDATIIRTSQTFGPEDKLLNWFGLAGHSTIAQPIIAPVAFMPLIDGGQYLTKPVYMGDVIQGIMQVGRERAAASIL